MPPVDDKLGAATIAIQSLVACLEEEKEKNGKRSWMERNPTIAVFFLGIIVVGGQFVAQKYVQGEIIAPIEEATEKQLEELKMQYERAEVEDAKERRVLRQNDGDIAEHALESDRYNHTILEGISNKMRVATPEKPPELEDAEKRVREVKRRGRE